ncbi:MAG TPA: aspartyl/asparaginyl beta-hydroxylase domain-containing protein [Acidimicrobiales bacterium]|nr:aspartyl/asparaginyl beta-hydroxylase domain-containing protein [Acidimicrobiales bacterium]
MSTTSSTQAPASGAWRDKAVTAATELGARALHSTESWLLKYSLVPTTPFLPLGTFPWVERVEKMAPAVRAELDEVLSHREDLPNFQDISIDQQSISNDDGWKTFFFMAYGFRSEANCRRCPQTAALLDSVPGLVTGFFSILSPGKHIPPHRGPWRGVVRYHLALKVPEPASASGIKVGGEVAHWEEGKSLLFDDGYTHEAWNGTDDTRVVLFCDILRPLRPPADQVNRGLVKAISWSPFIQDARSRHEAWEKRVENLRWGNGN